MEKRTDIIYFSPTGGCRNAAEKVAGALGEKAVLRDITAIDKRIGVTIDSNMFVLCCPIFAHDVPEQIVDFINSAAKGKRAVIICCFGNVTYGGAPARVAGICRDAGVTLKAIIMLPTPHSYGDKVINAPQEYTDRASCISADIVKRVISGEKIEDGEYRIVSMPSPRTYRGIFQRFSSRIATKVIKSDACIKCGLCIRECPAGAIDKNIVINTLKCLTCGRCVKICPKGALTMRFKTPIVPLFINLNAKKLKPITVYI
jgi:ferredoxin/flavodoxin